MATTDPVQLLQRLSARAGTGRAVSVELADEALAWLTDAAPAILAGTDPAAALGLKGQRGAWQNAPVHRARRDRRDAILRELWELTEGDDERRGWTMADWITGWRRFNHEPLSPREARRVLGAIPEAARPHLDALTDNGLRIPKQRHLLRVVRPVSQGAANDGTAAGGGLV